MKINKLIIGNDKDIQKKNFYWNMVGSTLYAFASVILLISATRALGEEKASIFSLAFTTGQLMLTIGFFEMRPYQVTDISNKFKFEDYYTSRIITSALMIICTIIYVFIMDKFTLERAIVVILICMYKMMDGLADVYEGHFQKSGRLDIAGKSLSFRTIITSIVFIVTIFVTKNLIITSMLTFISAVIGVIIFDINIIKYFENNKVLSDFKKCKELLIECFPFFLGSFMYMYIFSAVRYSVNGNMPDEFLTYFNAIFMPTSTISLLSGFILKPLLTTLAISWEKRYMDEFKSIIIKLLMCIVGFTLIIVIGAYLLGIPVLSWLYGLDLYQYKFELIILMIAGGIGAAHTIFYYCLTVMRRAKSVLYGYGFTFVFALIFVNSFVQKLEMRGAAIFHLILMIVMALAFSVLTFIWFRKEKSIRDII